MTTPNLPATQTAAPPAESRDQHPVIAMMTSATAARYIGKFLPEGVDLERVAATVLLAVKLDKTGKLMQCTNESLILGVARIMQWGLELGTTAHLVPFKNKVGDAYVYEATPVADYKGLAELMIGSGAVRFIEPKVVYEGDAFSYRLGTDARLDHTPTSQAKRGAITHGYVLIHLPGGRIVFDVMAAEDLDKRRQQYSKQWKVGPLPAWWVKKTMVRDSSKLVPKSQRFAEKFAKVLAVIADEETVEIVPRIESSPIAALRDSVGHEGGDDDDRIVPVDESGMPEFTDDDFDGARI